MLLFANGNGKFWLEFAHVFSNQMGSDLLF